MDEVSFSRKGYLQKLFRGSSEEQESSSVEQGILRTGVFFSRTGVFFSRTGDLEKNFRESFAGQQGILVEQVVFSKTGGLQ